MNKYPFTAMATHLFRGASCFVISMSLVFVGPMLGQTKASAEPANNPGNVDISRAATAPEVPSAELVTNGGFETGDFTGWTLSGDTTNEGVNMASASSGMYGAFFGPSTPGLSHDLTQNINTTAGSLYDLSFRLTGPGTIFISWNGTIIDAFLAGGDGKLTKEPRLMATSASTAIKFSFTVDVGNTLLDEVSAVPTVSSPFPVQLANLSTRLDVETGDNALIGGFIITGAPQKKVMLRAIGPSLPVSGQLLDPILELHDSTSATIATNDNWQDSPDKQAIIDSTIPPSNEKESAILKTLTPGAYTAIVRGVNNGTGVASVEIYDLDRTVTSKLANISTRGLVQTGDNVMIGGMIILGDSDAKVIVRAIGPSLPVTGALQDPTLELHDSNGSVIESNDNWRSDQEAEIIASTVPPTNNAESAIVANLSPGAYTAIVRGVNNTTGIALVEAYQLDN